MRKLFTFLFGVFAMAASGQTFYETFESGDIPGAWTVVNTNDTYKWSIAPYEGTSDLERTVLGYEQGGSYAVSSETGRAMDGVTPDQWLISPSISVESGDVLNFMMGHNSAYNGNANVVDENKVKFEVVVSTTGTDAEDFTYTLISMVPESAKNWSNYSFSLDQFAGQQIHIAFHDYGTTASIPYITNTLYLDDIRINKEKVSDLQVTGIVSPISSCNTQQLVTATVANIGFDCASYTMNCQIDGGETVTETVNTPLVGGATVAYTFASPMLLSAGSAHEVKVWAEALSDSNHDNDAFAAEVKIGDEIPFPFAMTDDNAETAFSSSYTRTSGWVTMGWAYYNDAMMKGWVYNPGLTSYLLSSCIALPKGTVKLSFDYMALSTAKLNVYLVTEPGVYDCLAGSIELPAAEEYTAGSMTFNVPDDDIYTIAITPDNSYVGSFYLDYIKIDETGADVAVVSIDSPKLNATLAQSGVTVAATFRNAGGTLLENIPVCCQLDNGTILRETIDRIEVGESHQHTFATGTVDLSAVGSHTLKVWTEMDGDSESANNAITQTISAYEAYDFPFEASFEADEQNENWITYNADNDILYWEIMQVIDGNINYAKDGQQAAYMSSASGIEHNDWLISPAINASKGDARISFYYTTRMNSSSGSDGCNIKLYLATTDDPDEISKDAPLAVFTLTDDNVLVYKQGYSPVEIPADGTYYVAFYNDGMGHDVILDDVRFDQSEDLSILSAANSSVSGFNLTENTVIVEIANHGTTTQSGFKAAYTVNGGAPVEETVQQSIAPGESLQYAFSNKVDVSAPGTYQISVSVVADNDADAFNNNWTLPEFTSYANAGLPYAVDFDTEEQREQWTAEGNWMVAANMTTSQSAYNGKGALYHTGAASADGDWVYSGCIEIPAGIYDLSFFYRTFMNMTDVERYGQNFSIYLGEEKNPEAMTTLLYSVEGTVVTTKVYEKVLQQVEIEESGNYYIGVKCTTTSSWGALYLDMIALEEPVTEGLALGTYESDFAGKFDEWYQYNPADNFSRWELGTGVGGSSCLTASTTSYFYGNMPADLPGMIVAPAFKLRKGDEINASLVYRIAVDNIDDLTEEDKARIKIGVYLADKNLPQAFTTQMALGTTVSDDVQTATGKITVPADGIYYVGVLADGQRSAISNMVTSSYELYSVKLWNEDNGGVVEIADSKPFVYFDNVVRMLYPYESLRIYSVGGVLVGQYSGVDEIALGNLAKGVYVVSVKIDDKIVTDKVVVM